jgi:hypothetical protein
VILRYNLSRSSFRLRVFENRVLRKIFGRGSRGVKKTALQEALCSVLLTKYHSGDQVKKTEMGKTCGTYGEMRGAYRALVGKPEGRTPLGRPRHRWEDNIKMDLREVGWGAWAGSIWLRIGTGGGHL